MSLRPTSLRTRIIKGILILALIVAANRIPDVRLIAGAIAIAVVWMPARWFGEQPKTQN